MATTTLPKSKKYLTEEELVFLPPLKGNRFVDSTGQTFHQLTALGIVRVKGKNTFWACRCTCGKVVVIDGRNLRSGQTKSCGCRQREAGRVSGSPSVKHGLSRTPEYQCWQSMMDRCADPEKPRNKRYAGRGIKVCDRWLHSFENFLADMGHRPSSEHTLERKDNNGDYEPGNCKWATRIEQANNRRTSRYFVIAGERKTVAQWCRHLGLDPDKDRARVLWRLEHGRTLEDLRT